MRRLNLVVSGFADLPHVVRKGVIRLCFPSRVQVYSRKLLTKLSPENVYEQLPADRGGSRRRGTLKDYKPSVRFCQNAFNLHILWAS